MRTDTDKSKFIIGHTHDIIDTFVGIQFSDKHKGIPFSDDAEWKFIEITCPCGIKDTYSFQNLPTVDTLHSCGNPKHWTVKY